MKLIFRYCLLTYFPVQPPLITLEQLQEALAASKFDFKKYNLTAVIDVTHQTVEQLIIGKDEVENLIREMLENNPALPQVQVGQLLSVWDAEKHAIFKQIISNNTQSCIAFERMEWSVRRNVSCKHGGHQTDGTAQICINAKNGAKFRGEMKKSQIKQLSKSIGRARSLLDSLFGVREPESQNVQ